MLIRARFRYTYNFLEVDRITCILYTAISQSDSIRRRQTVELTPEMAARYAGGQIEVQNPNEGYLYRGEIATATVEGEGDDASFSATLRWMAKGVGDPLPSRWVNDTNLTYRASLLIYGVSDIGDERICLQSSIIGELVVLFPPDGSKLDPSKVEGLNLG